MALPETSQDVIDNVEEAEQAEAREQALASTNGAALATPEAGTSAAETLDPMKALAAMGFEDLQIDFTSFPTLVINKGKIRKSGGDVIDDGESIEFVIMDKRKTFLFRGIKDRETDPELAYSDDKLHINMTGELVTEVTDKWKAEGLEVEVKDYFIVMGKMVGGSLDEEIIQIQIPKTSIGRFDGYLVSTTIAGFNPKQVVTRVSVGEEIGSGMKAFTPFQFNRVRS
ncbi:MAG: hypothetical protein DRR06_13820 [Gammaproteobacteria bacterium]|nr:MAG: hypothetical protein DRR06_13820 [Gammaproteobacteria bacterium]